MSVSRRRINIGGENSGIFMTVLIDEKRKDNSISVRFISPLTEENAARNACIPFVMEDTSKDYPDITSFNRRLSGLYGAHIRGGIGRFGSTSVISFSAASIADKYALEGERITYDVISMLSGCIFEPVTEVSGAGITRFPEKQFELKKQELIDDINADINDKRNYAIKQAGRIIFRNEPAGIPVKGEKEAAQALSSEEVYDAYLNMLASSRIEITFVGKELPADCEELIVKRFSAIKRENVFIPEMLPSPKKAEPEYFTDRLDVVQSKMVMAFKYNASRADRAVMKVFTVLYGGSPFSKLFKNVREKLSLCYYCSASNLTKYNTLLIDSGVESANIKPAQEEIIRQLEAVKNGDFTDENLEQSKLYITASLKAVNDTARAVSSWYFEDCLEDEKDIVTPEQFIELIQAVTRDEVIEFARRLALDTVYVLDGKEV